LNKILKRIEAQAGVPGLAAILAERLAPTDLQSLLLEVYRARSRDRTPADVLADYRGNRFVRPSQAAPACLLRWEQSAFAQLPPEFQTLELSPVCPLGTTSVLASLDQNWVVSTARNTEVVSDCTNVLALEAALQRRELLTARSGSPETVHLATSHRLLRGQKYADPTLATHFSLFGLCSAGRGRGGLRFELEALGTHIRCYLAAMRAFLGPEAPLRLTVTPFSEQARSAPLETALLDPIQTAFEIPCEFDEGRTSGRKYYRDLAFHIYAATPDGREMHLCDGGSVDWTQQLLSDDKERLVISGLGSERLCTEFGQG
jgi:hypothetical protein